MLRGPARWIGIALLLAPARARAGDEWSAAPTPVDRAVPSLSIAAAGAYMDYAETVAPPFKSTETGVLPGAIVTGAIALPSRFLLRGGLGFAAGTLHYDGSTQAGAPLAGDHPGLVLDAEADAGFRLTHGDRARAVVYAGLGWRYWRRDLSPIAGGYLEEYHWWRIPLGVEIDTGPGSAFTVGLDAAVVPSFGGGVSARLSQISPLFSDLDLPLGSGFGARASVPASWRVSPALRVFASLGYEYVPFDAGSAAPVYDANGNLITQNGLVLQAHEPESRTHLVTLALGVGL